MATPTPPDLCCTPLSSAPIDDDDASQLAAIMKALADPVRLKLISVIAAAGEGCACDFPAITGKSQPTVSHHLSQLVDAGILHREQRGKWAWFTVDEERLGALRNILS